jgi:hypothetical protein
MPLKPDDLKTFEAYKKAIKQDLSKISKQGNTKFWVYKDIELPTASGGKQKLPALISLVDDVATKAVLKGKPPLCLGTCGLEGDKISFHATQGKVPYATLTKSVPLLLGKMVHVPSGADVDSDGEGHPPPPPPPPPGGSAPMGRYAQLNGAWKQLAQQAEERIKAHPGEQARLAQAMADIPKMLQGGQLGEAEKSIALLQGALKIPPPPPPPPPGGAPNYAQLNASWKQFSEQASQRMATFPAMRDGLTKAMAGIPELLQGGQLGEARKRLEQLQAAIKAPPPPPPPPGGAPGGRAGAGSGQPAGQPYPGIVKYRQALLEFAQAKSRVQGQIRGLQTAITSRLPHAADFANDLAEEIEDLNRELAGAVDEAMKAAENEASPATDAVKMKIRKYQTELSSNKLIQRADSNPFGVSVTVAKTLGDALQRIRDAMPA